VYKEGLGYLSVCAVASRSSPSTHVCICNGHPGSELCCVHCNDPTPQPAKCLPTRIRFDFRHGQDFSFRCHAWIGYGAHLASYPKGIGIFPRRQKWMGRNADVTIQCRHRECVELGLKSSFKFINITSIFCCCRRLKDWILYANRCDNNHTLDISSDFFRYGELIGPYRYICIGLRLIVTAIKAVPCSFSCSQIMNFKIREYYLHLRRVWKFTRATTHTPTPLHE
jgi:hypothetical protein